MKSHILLVFVLNLTVFWSLIFSMARFQYSGVDQYREEANHYKAKWRQQQLEKAIVQAEFQGFQQTVATLIPGKIPQNDASFYPLRSLASAVQSSGSLQLKIVTAKNLLQDGKRLFRAGDYLNANEAFQKIIDHYSYSPEVIEAYFLYSEGLYQQHSFEQCAQAVRSMIELFPASELTGFAMLRLGRIYESQNRSSEAVDIYKTVLWSFAQRDLASQAKESLKQVEL